MTEMTPDCPHGEYTLVTGAQTSVLALQITVFGVKCTKCGKQWDMGDMMTAPARLEALEKVRDLAVAHDRQPYPTAWAYEQLAKVHEADRKAMRDAHNLLERADHQYYASEAEAILRAVLRGEEET